MPVATKKQIRDSALATTSQDNTQIGSMVNDFINITLNEINNPAWAFKNGYNHLWSWLRRKMTFATVGSTADYVMERDVDRIAILRQTSSPIKLSQIPDEIFFREMPNPTATGSPLWYRLWEVTGLSTKLTAADTISIVSSSTSDGTTFTVSIVGYVGGKLDSEVLTMNGTTTVTSTKSWDAREVFISKSGITTGNITVKAVSANVTILTLGAQETSPRFKVVTLYPTPGSAITMYVEYYKAIRELVNDSEAPEFSEKWHHVVRIGTIAKIYQYLGKTTDFLSTQELYAQAVRGMIQADKANPDLIVELRRDMRAYNGGCNYWLQDVRTEIAS